MKRIEEYIELANKAVENISYPAEPNGLYEPIRYGMAQGGKRLRPALLLAACDAATQQRIASRYYGGQRPWLHTALPDK